MIILFVYPYWFAMLVRSQTELHNYQNVGFWLKSEDTSINYSVCKQIVYDKRSKIVANIKLILV